MMSLRSSQIDDDVPASTRWHRAHGRPSRKDKAVKQQVLTPQEEKAAVEWFLLFARNGYAIPAKGLPPAANILIRQRPTCRNGKERPCKVGKNWHVGFYKRHPELKPRRLKALDWTRHDCNIHSKIGEWFDLMGTQLKDSAFAKENIYNMDETGVLLSSPTSIKVLVIKDDRRNYRGAAKQRTLVTAVECISASGTSLPPLIIWPAATLRSTWTSHPTPGWHFACSASGYTNSTINLYWIQNVFDPATRERAGGRPRMLISYGFATHESLEVLTFCYENNIVLCRLPSHTSHKLQPCDVGVFGPLKQAYRDQVGLLYRRGSNTIGKQHFTLLYDRARRAALTSHNICAGWARAGLFPFNPERVFREVAKPAEASGEQNPASHFSTPIEAPLRTPTTAVDLSAMRLNAQTHFDALDDDTKLYVEKLANAAERALATVALVHEENQHLLVQNNEKKTREGTKPTMVGRAKIMSYEDIVEAQRKREGRERESEVGRRRTRANKARPVSLPTSPALTLVADGLATCTNVRGHKRMNRIESDVLAPEAEAARTSQTQIEGPGNASGPWRAPIAQMW